MGRRARYNLGFALYWLSCVGATLLILGPARTLALFAPRPIGWVAGLLLLAPVAGAVGYAFVPRLRQATPVIVVVAIARAAANALAEELFWRGVFIATFPRDPWLGWLVPAALFAAWHVIPLHAAGEVRGHAAFLAGAAAIGVAYGWVAWSTGSLLWTTPAHFLVDACGLDAARLALGLPRATERSTRG